MEPLLRARIAQATGGPELSQDAQQALDRLLRLRTPNALKAALLAGVLAPGHDRRLEAWFDETVTIREADAVRSDMAALGPAALLPWFERVLQRLATHPLAERKALLVAVRRLITVPGTNRAIDRLFWLAVRRGFGEHAWQPASPAPAVDTPRLPPERMPEVARFTAQLARTVPSDDPESLAGRDWYLSVMFHWQPPAEVPAWRPPDADTLVHALAALERLSWVERPILVRCWVREAIAHSSGEWLAPAAADALRLACTLLDCPLPPDLARHYIALPEDPRE